MIRIDYDIKIGSHFNIENVEDGINYHLYLEKIYKVDQKNRFVPKHIFQSF